MSFLLNLQRGGYPFAADELELEEWLAMGRLKDDLEKVALENLGTN